MDYGLSSHKYLFILLKKWFNLVLERVHGWWKGGINNLKEFLFFLIFQQNAIEKIITSMMISHQTKPIPFFSFFGLMLTSFFLYLLSSALFLSFIGHFSGMYITVTIWWTTESTNICIHTRCRCYRR